MNKYWAKIKGYHQWEMVQEIDGKYYFIDPKSSQINSEVKEEILRLDEIKQYEVVTFENDMDFYNFMINLDKQDNENNKNFI